MPQRTDEDLGREGEMLSPMAAQLMAAAFAGDLAGVEHAILHGAGVNTVDPQTGLSALHVAAGRDDIPLCKMLVEQWKAEFFPDRFGRWPTLVAAECRVSDELSDYIVEKEAAFLASQTPRRTT